MQRSDNLNLYLPGNGDSQDITQISWNFDKLDDEVLTKSAQTLTASQQEQIVTNLGLGGAATAAVANNLTTSAAGSVLDARQADDLAENIRLASTDDTWAEVWAKINGLRRNYTATLYCHSTAVSILTGGAVTSGTWYGTLTKSGSDSFEVFMKSTSNQVRAGRITGASSSSSGTWSDVRLATHDGAMMVNGLGNVNNNTKTITNTGTATVRCLLIGSSSASAREFLFMAVIAPSGSNYATQIYKGSNITISASSSGISVSTSASYATAVYAVAFSGNVYDLDMS